MKLSPFDYMKSINHKNYLEDISGFVPFLTNKVYSVDQNYVFVANMMNKLNANALPKRAVYDFYYNIIPKNKKWLKYPSNIKDPKYIKYVMEYYGVNEIVAKEYSIIMDPQEMKTIVKYFEKREMK